LTVTLGLGLKAYFSLRLDLEARDWPWARSISFVVLLTHDMLQYGNNFLKKKTKPAL